MASSPHELDVPGQDPGTHSRVEEVNFASSIRVHKTAGTPAGQRWSGTARPAQGCVGGLNPPAVSVRSPEQFSLVRSIVLHLAPGAVFTAFVVLVAPVFTSWGLDASLALFGGIGVVLVPLELGYLAFYARQTTGSWSPLRAVDYRARVPARRLMFLAFALAFWFLACLLVSMALVDQWLARGLFSWLPAPLLQFAGVEVGGEPLSGGMLVAFASVAIAFNCIAGPITEELYFRGHLLPRIARYGRWAPIINTALFAMYHFFSPWRYPAIFIGFLPIGWMAWRERSVLVSIAAHVLINTVTVLLLILAVLATNQ